jgi:hypothetical protein
MPVRSVKNQYRGINAHLHSFWQGEHKWNRFHNVHVAHLMAGLKAQLLPLGYTAETEESLQIRRIGDTPRQPRADIVVRDLDPLRPPQFSSALHAPTLTVEELVGEADFERPYYAVAVYERSPDTQAVAWVELLSPTNKGILEDAQTYLAKRRLLLEQGIVFVELDYLHETPPTFAPLDDYTRREPHAHPYRIVVLDPRPDFRTGPSFVGEFDADEPIPTVTIPLNAGDRVDFDFNAAYQKTFVEALYGYDMDYAALPLNFERYNEADQTRIARRMLSVLEAAAAGIDLETGPFPIKDIPLNEALTQTAMLQNKG